MRQECLQQALEGCVEMLIERTGRRYLDIQEICWLSHVGVRRLTPLAFLEAFHQPCIHCNACDSGFGNSKKERLMIIYEQVAYTGTYCSWSKQCGRVFYLVINRRDLFELKVRICFLCLCLLICAENSPQGHGSVQSCLIDFKT